MDLKSLISSLAGGEQRDNESFAPLMAMMEGGQDNMNILARLLPLLLNMQNSRKQEPEREFLVEKPKPKPNYFSPILDIATAEIIFAMALILSN